MSILSLDALRRLAADFRHAIERSRAGRDVPHPPCFPEGACRLTSRLLALHLVGRGHRAERLASGTIPDLDVPVRHTWLLVVDHVVDLTADPFGEAPVVVGAPTRFDESLLEREERSAAEEISAFTADEAARYARLLAPIEARLDGSRTRPA